MSVSSIRLVLIYTGKTEKADYPKFQRDELNKLDKASGFVLTPNDQYGIYGRSYEKHYPYLIAQMEQLPSKPFYVGLPPVNISNGYTGQDCIADFAALSNFVERVFEEVQNLNKMGSFKGFYFTTERIPGTVDASSPLSNPMVKLMSDLSGLIRKTHKKQFIWAPYLGYNEMYYTINENIGIVANRMNIFTTIFLQSGYYFKDAPDHGDIPRQNLTLAAKCAQNRAVYNYRSEGSYTVSSTPVCGSKTSTTAIGIDMEVDNSLYRELENTELEAKDRNYKKNYTGSCISFSPIFKTGTCQFLFYADSHYGLIDCHLYETVNAFYDNGACKMPSIQ